MTRHRLGLAIKLVALGSVLLFLVLIAQQGFGAMVTALGVAGWGLLWLPVLHLVPLALSTAGWWRLLDVRHGRPSRSALLWMRWIGESISGLLPVATVGGDLIRARLLTHSGFQGARSGASVVVDITVGIFAQIIFTSLGLAVLSTFLGTEQLMGTILLGLAVSAVVLLAFYLVQRRGLFRGIARVFKRVVRGPAWDRMLGGAQDTDEAIGALYRDRARILSAVIWRLGSWISGSVEVWFAAFLLGYPIDLLTALMIESLSAAVRTAAFLVPGALGVQEGSYLLLGSLLGLTPQIALALSLAKRVREIILGVPGLLAWQFAEGRRLLCGADGSVIEGAHPSASEQ